MGTLEVTKEKLYNFSSFLNEDGFAAQVYEPDENNIIYQLLIPITPNEGETEEETPLIQVMFVEDVLEVSGHITKEINDTFIIQFFVPILINNQKFDINEMNIFLSYLNKLVPIGYFGNGVEGIFFRHTVVTNAKNIERETSLEIVRLISFFTKRFYKRILALAEGTKTKEVLLKELDDEIKGLNL